MLSASTILGSRKAAVKEGSFCHLAHATVRNIQFTILVYTQLAHHVRSTKSPQIPAVISSKDHCLSCKPSICCGNMPGSCFIYPLVYQRLNPRFWAPIQLGQTPWVVVQVQQAVMEAHHRWAFQVDLVNVRQMVTLFQRPVRTYTDKLGCPSSANTGINMPVKTPSGSRACSHMIVAFTTKEHLQQHTFCKNILV